MFFMKVTLSIPYDDIFMTITIKLDNQNESQLCTNHNLEETDRLASHVLRNTTSCLAIWQNQNNLMMARNRHHEPLGWILLSLYTSPLLTWIILFIAGDAEK